MVQGVLLECLADAVATTVNVGKAMIRVARDEYPRRIVETRDINILAGERKG